MSPALDNSSITTALDYEKQPMIQSQQEVSKDALARYAPGYFLLNAADAALYLEGEQSNPHLLQAHLEWANLDPSLAGMNLEQMLKEQGLPTLA